MKAITALGRPDSVRRITDVYIALLLSFFLLYTGKNGYLSIVEAKYAAFMWMTGVYLGLILLCGLAQLVSGRREGAGDRRRSPGAVRILAALYLVFSLVSWCFSDFREASFYGATRYEGLVTIAAYTALFLCISLFSRPRPWMLMLFGASMTAFCLISTVQLAGGNPFGLYPEGMNYAGAYRDYSGAYIGTIGNVDLAAALLCLAVPAFSVGVIRMKGRFRFLLAIPAALCLFVLCAVKVEAGAVGIAGGMLLAAAVIPEKAAQRTAAAAAIAVFAICAAAAVWFFGDHMPGFLREAHEILHGRIEDTFGSGRILIWRQTWRAIRQRPVWGGGPDTLGLRIETVFERYDAESGRTFRAGIDVAHNEYLNIWANCGLPALLAYLAALLASAVKWVKRAPYSTCAALCGAAAACWCVQAFFGISMCVTAPFFWLTWGLLEKAADG